MRLKGLVVLVCLVVLLMAAESAAAQCADGDAGDNTIACTGLNAQNISGNDGNDSMSNTGGVNNGSVFDGGAGNDTIVNQGGVNNGSDVDGGAGNDTIVNSGGIGSTSDIEGGDNDDVISNSGDITGGGSAFTAAGIDGGTGNDTISNSGNMSNFAGIAGGDGDDTVNMSADATMDANSLLDGDFLNFIQGNNDTLVFTFNTTDPGFAESATFQAAVAQINAVAPNLGLCQGGTPCQVAVNGNLYTFTNFENLQAFINFIAAGGSPASQWICDNGVVKVFSNFSTDLLEVYAGFSSDTPNGFLVALIPTDQLEAGLRFENVSPDNPGWYVILGGDNYINVYDGVGNFVNGGCRYRS